MTHVDALVLSLASANIVEVQRTNNIDRWNICRTHPSNAETGVARYHDKDTWAGINLHSEDRRRRRNADLLLNKPVRDPATTESDSDSTTSDEDDEMSGNEL